MKKKNGEHPLGDSGQLVLLVLFLLIWVVDSFFLRISTFLSDDVSLLIRLVILSPALIAAVYLIHSIEYRNQRRRLMTLLYLTKNRISFRGSIKLFLPVIFGDSDILEEGEPVATVGYMGRMHEIPRPRLTPTIIN